LPLTIILLDDFVLGKVDMDGGGGGGGGNNGGGNTNGGEICVNTVVESLLLLFELLVFGFSFIKTSFLIKTSELYFDWSDLLLLLFVATGDLLLLFGVK
jgi:hypothetical protein